MNVIDLLFAHPVGFQAFWVWLVICGVILGFEALIGTQWLLWPAAAAGVVALLSLTGLPNLFVQIVVFFVLTMVLAVLAKRFLKVKDPVPDINDSHLRLVGREALVIEAFDDQSGHENIGRVILDGVEWPAVFEHASGNQEPILPEAKVKIVKVYEGRLFIKPA
ncbi:MAG: NfeD family protein [Asticcacaulis sp.]